MRDQQQDFHKGNFGHGLGGIQPQLEQDTVMDPIAVRKGKQFDQQIDELRKTDGWMNG